MHKVQLIVNSQAELGGPSQHLAALLCGIIGNDYLAPLILVSFCRQHFGFHALGQRGSGTNAALHQQSASQHFGLHALGADIMGDQSPGTSKQPINTLALRLRNFEDLGPTPPYNSNRPVNTFSSFKLWG